MSSVFFSIDKKLALQKNFLKFFNCIPLCVKVLAVWILNFRPYSFCFIEKKQLVSCTPPFEKSPTKAHRFHVLPPLKNHPSKVIGFVYSPLWKITHQSPSVSCTPPFEKSLFWVGAYFGVGVYLGKYGNTYVGHFFWGISFFFEAIYERKSVWTRLGWVVIIDSHFSIRKILKEKEKENFNVKKIKKCFDYGSKIDCFLGCLFRRAPFLLPGLDPRHPSGHTAGQRGETQALLLDGPGLLRLPRHPPGRLQLRPRVLRGRGVDASRPDRTAHLLGAGWPFPAGPARSGEFAHPRRQVACLWSILWMHQWVFRDFISTGKTTLKLTCWQAALRATHPPEKHFLSNGHKQNHYPSK